RDIDRWKHLSAVPEQQEESYLTVFVIEKMQKQLGMFMAILIVVSAVMDLLRRIALDQEAAILVVTHGRLVSIETLAEASADKRAETISAG
ncbi:MAG TPA: hypothetical protein VNF04_09690, partial [Stellaceae bacterium]|nr:hypothetical protein [Stellaceae bacterium]